MKVNKLQLSRIIIQVLFLILLFIGLFFKIKPIFGAFLILALLSGNFYCGWICPFGAMQDIFGRLGSLFIKNKYKMPYSIQKYLQFSRYILLILFISILGNNSSIAQTINSYKIFISISLGNTVEIIALIIMLSFLLISMFFERPFCNYFCSEGIKYAVLSLGRIWGIKRNSETCINCKQCNKVCPMNIQISTKENVRNAQCINCFECISACPKKGALSYKKIINFRKKSSSPTLET